jgi:Arc/MetJ-type ribon-helix-helix transcriptional regulator
MRTIDVKTIVFTLAIMANRLLNVRLTPEDERLAKRLRARGLSLSEIVRRALREAAAEVDDVRLVPAELETEMFRLHPTPVAGPSNRPDALDRRAVRDHVRAKLHRGRR